MPTPLVNYSHWISKWATLLINTRFRQKSSHYISRWRRARAEQSRARNATGEHPINQQWVCIIFFFLHNFFFCNSSAGISARLAFLLGSFSTNKLRPGRGEKFHKWNARARRCLFIFFLFLWLDEPHNGLGHSITEAKLIITSNQPSKWEICVNYVNVWFGDVRLAGKRRAVQWNLYSPRWDCNHVKNR